MKTWRRENIKKKKPNRIKYLIVNERYETSTERAHKCLEKLKKKNTKNHNPDHT